MLRAARRSKTATRSRLIAPNPRCTTRGATLAPDGDAESLRTRSSGFVVPACTQCGGVLKPRVVFFGDSVPCPIVDEAFAATDAAELLLVVGTSLAIYSGYRFLRRAVERHIPVAIVNRGPVRGEESAAIKVEAGSGATLEGLARESVSSDGARGLRGSRPSDSSIAQKGRNQSCGRIMPRRLEAGA